jgi:hypothetical protein
MHIIATTNSKQFFPPYILFTPKSSRTQKASITFTARRLDSKMGKILDTDKLGSVFGTRPDILTGIQKAAGKQCSP